MCKVHSCCWRWAVWTLVAQFLDDLFAGRQSEGINSRRDPFTLGSLCPCSELTRNGQKSPDSGRHAKMGSFVGLLGVRNLVKRNLVLLTFRLPCLQVFAVQQITLVFTSYFEQTKYLRVFWKSKIIQKSSKNPVSVIAPSEGTTSLPSTRMGKLSLLPPPCVLIPSSILPGHWPGKPRLQLTSYIIRYGSRCLLFAVCGGSVEEWILL